MVGASARVASSLRVAEDTVMVDTMPSPLPWRQAASPAPPACPPGRGLRLGGSVLRMRAAGRGRPVAARLPMLRAVRSLAYGLQRGRSRLAGGPQGGGLAGPAEPHTIRTGPRLTPIPLVGRVAVPFPPQLAGSEGQRRAQCPKSASW